ncbi:MAG: hypothetical protein QGI36_04195 [Candidatus Thalassarchaeaceae archaeon]|jgi:hypothetical protein|nr:hypothetical protein [Candidatus Thalassarchaeaceae archaeon]
MGEQRDGERIPRKSPPPYDEVSGGLRGALRTHGLIGTALLDKNQYGPQAMILLLVLTATGTALALGALMVIS